MKFIREVYETELIPTFKQLFITIVKGIKNFFGLDQSKIYMLNQTICQFDRVVFKTKM